MLGLILILLIIFWFMGYGPLTALRIPLFSLGHLTVNLWNILIFLLILGLINALPGVLRAVAIAALVLWLLGLFGLIAIPIFSNLVILAVILGLALYLISGRN